MLSLGRIDNFLTHDEINWFLWYWQVLPTKIDTGQRIRSMVHFDQPFFHRVKQKLTDKVKSNDPNEEITTVNLNQDYAPGGIHSDGYIDFDKDDDISLTYLIPIKMDNFSHSTIIFNEESKKAVSLNEENGLGSTGLVTYPQVSRKNLGLVDSDFDHKLHEQYLKHLTYNSIKGLTIAELQTWKLGTALVWPREKLHCSSYFQKTTDRMSLLITTRRRK